jgi:hypothetical protein
MANKTTAIVFKAIALAVSWLTLSPLLLILDGRWKLLPKWLRIVLFVLSPMMLAIVAVTAFRGYVYYSEHYMQRHFIKPRVVENITGVRFPRYKVVNQGEERKCFSRFPEHTYDYTLEFKRMPDDAFYEKLDEHFDNFEQGRYSYSTIWGNGIKSPKGESDKDDISFSIDIERDSKTFYIRVMEW